MDFFKGWALIRVLRKTLGPDFTTGEMYGPDGSFWCYTLEDTVRNIKIDKKTAIPAGGFEVVVSWSNRFQRLMPRLLGVPFFNGVLIHSGNTADHTEGCILIGKKIGAGALQDSLLAFEEVFPKIKKLTEKGKLFVQVEGGFEANFWIKDPYALGVG